MTVKTILLAFFLTCVGLWAQTPAATDDNANTNRDEILRQALRRAVEGKTNPPGALAVPPLTAPAAAETPVAAPVVIQADAPAATNRLAVPSRIIVPSNPADTNAPTNRLAL